MTSQLGKQTIAIHMLPNISRRNGHQTMKLGQLTKYDMTNHRQNVMEKVVQDPFGKY